MPLLVVCDQNELIPDMISAGTQPWEAPLVASRSISDVKIKNLC